MKKKTGGNSAHTQPRWQSHYWLPLPVPSSELHLEDTKLKDPLALEKIILCEMWLTGIKNRRHTLVECFLWEDKENTLATFSLTQSDTEWNNESIYCFMEPKELWVTLQVWESRSFLKILPLQSSFHLLSLGSHCCLQRITSITLLMDSCVSIWPFSVLSLPLHSIWQISADLFYFYLVIFLCKIN